MPRKIEYRGQIHSFPDNFTDEDIQEALATLDASAKSPRWRIYGLAAAIVVVLIVAALTLPRGAALTTVTFHGVPAGATLLVNDSVAVDTIVQLPEGQHRWAVTADGFEPATGNFEAKRAPLAVNVQLFALAPPPPPDTMSIDTAAANPFGRILVLTPNEDGVTVAVNGQERNKTVRGQLLIDSIAPGPYTITVKKASLCVVETRPRRVTVVADSQSEVRFTLKALPRLVLNIDPASAHFRLQGDTATRRAGQEYPLEPKTYRYTVSAAQHEDVNGEVSLSCGQAARPVAVRLNRIAVAATPPVESTSAKPPLAETGWDAGCFKPQDEWQKAAKDCFYGSRLSAYEFEVRRSGGGYGTWFMGRAGEKVEFRLDGDKYRVRSKDGKWQDGEKLAIPKDNKSLYIRVTSDGATATVRIALAPGAAPLQEVRLEAPSGFGVKKDFQLKEFRRSQ